MAERMFHLMFLVGLLILLVLAMMQMSGCAMLEATGDFIFGEQHEHVESPQMVQQILSDIKELEGRAAILPPDDPGRKFIETQIVALRQRLEPAAEPGVGLDDLLAQAPIPGFGAAVLALGIVYRRYKLWKKSATQTFEGIKNAGLTAELSMALNGAQDRDVKAIVDAVVPKLPDPPAKP